MVSDGTVADAEAQAPCRPLGNVGPNGENQRAGKRYVPAVGLDGRRNSDFPLERRRPPRGVVRAAYREVLFGKR